MGFFKGPWLLSKALNADCVMQDAQYSLAAPGSTAGLVARCSTHWEAGWSPNPSRDSTSVGLVLGALQSLTAFSKDPSHC